MFDLIHSSSTVLNSGVTVALHNTLTTALELLLNVLVAGAIWALRTWLASMNSGWKKAIAERFVKYAAQKLDDKSGEEKRAWVASQISSHFPRLKQDEVNHLLEEAVVNLKTQITTGGSLDAPKILGVVSPDVPPTDGQQPG